MQAVVLSLYLESIREKISQKVTNNLNEHLFLDAEKTFSTQIPFSDIEKEVSDELDALHEIYNQKNNN
jgi:hypothetical protein